MSQINPRNLPDLRHDHQEFTLEHCSALLERTDKFFKKIHGDDSRVDTEKIDTEAMRDYLLELLNQDELSQIFDKDFEHGLFGQGILVGLFLSKLIELQESNI